MRATVACCRVAPIFLAALVSCRTAAPPPRAAAPAVSKPPAPIAKTPMEDCDALLNFVVPFAQKMLKERRAFIPFGATMSPSGGIDGSMSFTGDEKGDVNQLISLLELGFRQGATEGKYKATALVVDMVVVPPGKSTKQDGVAVRLDHRDGLSIVVGFPYSFSASGELMVEPPFANEGAHQIFPPPRRAATAVGERTPSGVRIPVARGWTVVVAADFEVIDNGDSLQALKGHRVVYLSAPALPAEKQADGAHALCAQTSTMVARLPEKDRLTHAAGALEGVGGFFLEGRVWRFKGVMCAPGTLAVFVADLLDENDRDWAVAAWRSFEHR